MSTVQRLRAEIKFLRATLKRLASMEAFDSPRCVDSAKDKELLLRIDFASSALSSSLKRVEKGAA